MVTLVKTRWHIFNRLPIRMLTFDSTGTNIRLVGRDDIFNCILPSVQTQVAESGSQKEWDKVQALPEMHWTNTAKQNALDKLVTNVIESCSHYAILSHLDSRVSR